MEKGLRADGALRKRGLSSLPVYISNRSGYWPLAICFALFFVFSYGAQPLLYKLINPEIGPGFPPLDDSAFSLLIATAVIISFLVGATTFRFRHQSKPPKRKLEFPFLIPIFIAVVSAGLAANWALLAVGGGVTIYTYGFQMPGSFSGVMSAIRLIAFPAIFAFLLQNSWGKNQKQLFIMITGTLLFGATSSIASGSHLIAVTTALPLLFALRLKPPGRLTLFAAVLCLQLILAAGSRIFFLPFWFKDDWTIHDMYFEAWIINGSQILPLLMTPILYPINRSSGLYELSLTARFLDGSYFADFSFLPVMNYFVPSLGKPNSVNARDVLGIETAMGGFGLDLVSNLWLAFGPNVVALSLGSFILGLIVGTVYRSLSEIVRTLDISSSDMAVSFGLLLLVFSPSLGPLLLALAIGVLMTSKLVEFFFPAGAGVRHSKRVAGDCMPEVPGQGTGSE